MGVVDKGRVEQKFGIEDDQCFLYTFVDMGDGHPRVAKQLIMNKDIFVACYKEWVLGENNGKTNE